MLGALSCFFEIVYPGIVVTAVLATLVVIGVTLGAFSFGFIRNSGAVTRIATIGSISFLLLLHDQPCPVSFGRG